MKIYIEVYFIQVNVWIDCKRNFKKEFHRENKEKERKKEGRNEGKNRRLTGGIP